MKLQLLLLNIYHKYTGKPQSWTGRHNVTGTVLLTEALNTASVAREKSHKNAFLPREMFKHCFLKKKKKVHRFMSKTEQIAIGSLFKEVVKKNGKEKQTLRTLILTFQSGLAFKDINNANQEYKLNKK